MLSTYACNYIENYFNGVENKDTDPFTLELLNRYQCIDGTGAVTENGRRVYEANQAAFEQLESRAQKAAVIIANRKNPVRS